MPGWQTLTHICDGVEIRCGFPQFIMLIKNGITDMILLSTLLVVAALAVAGIQLLTSGGNPSKLTAAKDMAWKIVKGYMWILIAWLLVYTITSKLLNADYFFLLGTPSN